MKAIFLILATVMLVESSPGIAGVKAEYSGAELAKVEELRRQELQAQVDEAIASSQPTVNEARLIAAKQDAEDAEAKAEEETPSEVATRRSSSQPYTIQNNINVGYAPAPVAEAAPAPAPVQLAMVETTSATTLQAAEASESDSSQALTITPMVGTLGYVGRWGRHVDNRYAFGLALEQPLGERFGVELEGDYSRSYISYSSFGHYFNRYGLAGNGKLYLMRGTFNPYVGAGLQANLYQNMSQGPTFPANYDHWLGSGQVMAGGDVKVSNGVMIGVRGAYSHPLINKPLTVHNQVQSFPRYEESAAINTGFYRVLGAVKVNL